MEQVVVSPPVQERLDIELPLEGVVDAKLTKRKKKRRRKRSRSNGNSKNKLLLADQGDIPSVARETSVVPSSANGDVTTASRDICSPADGKSLVSSTNATDKTVSRDIIQTLEETIRRLQEENAQMRSRFKRDMQLQLQRQVEQHTQPRDFCSPADGKSLISSTNAPDKTVSSDIISPAATVDKQVTVLSSAPVQECLVMGIDKDKDSVKLTGKQRRNRNYRLNKKAKKALESLVKREGVDNPGSLGAVASVDPKMMVLTPAATVNEKSSIPSTKATDQIVSGDTLSTKVHEAVSGETCSDKTVTDSTPSKKRKRNQRAKKTAVGDGLSAKVDEVVSSETVEGKTVTGNTTPEKKKMEVAGDVLSTEVQEVMSGETVLGKTATINTTPKKKKRKSETVADGVLSTCENVQGKANAIEGLSATDITESISGEMVSGKTALPDVKMVSQEEHTEAANGKMGSSATLNLNVNGAVNSSLTAGEILTPQNLQILKAASGETGSGTNAADTTASKKRKRGKNKKKSPLSGDILSTCENTQDKANAIDGLRTTNALGTKVTNKMELSDITNHNVDAKKGPEVAKREMAANNRTSKRKIKKQKVGVVPSEKKEITQAPPGKKLIVFDVNGMLADIVFPRPKDVEADKYYHGKAVFKRPYLDDFLSFCFEKFHVGIWSSRMKKNLDPVVDCLFGDLKKKLLFIWDHSHCRNSGMRTLEDRYKFIVFKELRKIWENNSSAWVKGTFNESNTLLLDDSPYKALLNPKHTGIFPSSYKYTDTNDDYLGPTGALRTYLEGFAAAEDGRTYVEQNPFGEGAIDEKNRDWKYYSRVLKGQRDYCVSRGITI